MNGEPGASEWQETVAGERDEVKQQTIETEGTAAK